MCMALGFHFAFTVVVRTRVCDGQVNDAVEFNPIENFIHANLTSPLKAI